MLEEDVKLETAVSDCDWLVSIASVTATARNTQEGFRGSQTWTPDEQKSLQQQKYGGRFLEFEPLVRHYFLIKRRELAQCLTDVQLRS